MTPVHRRGENGFGIVPAIFVLVVLASAGAAMLSLVSVQRNTSEIGLLGLRGLFAARAGLEWSMRQINLSGDCSAIGAGTALALTEGALRGFNVSLSCQRELHVDGETYAVHSVVSIAEYGSPASPDYVRKRVRAVVVTRVP